MWLGWLILVVSLAILEIATVNLVSIWFIASGIVSLIVSFFVDSFYIQFLIFGVLGIILLITTRPILNKFLNSKKEKTNLDRVVGMEGIVTEDIKKNTIGEIKVAGKKWSAISKQSLKKGENVIVEKIDGVKLVVRREGK